MSDQAAAGEKSDLTGGSVVLRGREWAGAKFGELRKRLAGADLAYCLGDGYEVS